MLGLKELYCSFLAWVQNFSTVKWIVTFTIIPYSTKACLSQSFPIQARPALILFKYWSRTVKYCFNYVSIGN